MLDAIRTQPYMDWERTIKRSIARPVISGRLRAIRLLRAITGGKSVALTGRIINFSRNSEVEKFTGWLPAVIIPAYNES